VLNPSVADRPAPIPQALVELWELVVAYFKQETAEPLKSLGRVIGLGVAGSLLIGFGVIFVGVGILRLIQGETTIFDGNWSFVPYLIVVVVMIGIAGLSYRLAARPKDEAA
jgi:flagellar biosynthesis protein FliQ